MKIKLLMSIILSIVLTVAIISYFHFHFKNIKKDDNFIIVEVKNASYSFPMIFNKGSTINEIMNFLEFNAYWQTHKLYSSLNKQKKIIKNYDQKIFKDSKFIII